MTSPVDFPQWINWKPEWNAAKGKNDKFPWDYVRGCRVDAHDPANWKTYADAVASGFPIGFVLTERDPFGFIDLDKMRASPDAAWLPIADELYAPFIGAATEISDSGKGLHVLARVDALRVADRRNRAGAHLEFYTTKRFIALATRPDQWQGSFDVDITDAVLRVVPGKDAGGDTALTDGPRADYTGPANDDELIQKMLASSGGAGAQFGEKAHVRDLWTGDAANLCQVFPSEHDAYDRSRADGALMAHLAFWTGADAARMDRLFRRSALCREKYTQRKDYREATIGNALARCTRVYDHVSQAIEAPAETLPAMDGTKILLIHQMQQLFDGCVYVRDQHRMMIPGGVMLKPEQFRADYGGFEFYMQADGARPTRDAFEAFTQNRMHRFPKAEGTVFLPKMTPGAIVDNHVNNYFPQRVPMPEGDVSPFLDFLRRFLPVERDREILLAYLAAMVQHIGEKFPWCVVLQGVEGNGKSMILGIMEYALGKKYTHRPSAQDLANPFNSYLENKLAILVDEVHMDGRREMLDTLKPLITGTRVEVQNKGVDKRMIEFCANWLFATNYQDAVIKTRNDRRYAIFYTAQQDADDLEKCGMDGDYFPRLFKWLDGGGRGHVANYLSRYTIPVELNPAVGAGGLCHRAPETSSTQGAINATRGKAEQEVLEAIDADLAGFRGGWVNMEMMRDLLGKSRVMLSPQRAHQLLLDLGFVKVGRSTLIIMEEEKQGMAARPTLYVRKHLWRDGLGTNDYTAAQRYTSAARTVQGSNVVRMPGL